VLKQIDHPVELWSGQGSTPSWPGAPHAFSPAHLEGSEVPVRQHLGVGSEVDVLEHRQLAWIACLRPVCASEMTSWTPCRPRLFRLRRNAVQNAPSSESPTSNPSTSRRPSAATPVATTTAWDTTRWSTRALQ
jgi:hypothetical protein